MTAIATLGAGIFGGLTQAGAAGKAAKDQAAAAGLATQAQVGMFDYTAGLLQPFVGQGLNASTTLGNALPGLTAPIQSPDVTMNQNALQQTPGYQFNLTQGLKSTQNSAAARGLGVSGAALKGAAGYATGLADSTYQNQFANAQTNRATDIGLANTNKLNQFNFLNTTASLGENAGAMVGNQGTQVGSSIGQNLIGAGNAAAAGAIGQGNALAGAANSLPQSILLSNLTGGGGGFFGNSGGSGFGNAFNGVGQLFGGDVTMQQAAQAGLASGLTQFPDGSIG